MLNKFLRSAENIFSTSFSTIIKCFVCFLLYSGVSESYGQSLKVINILDYQNSDLELFLNKTAFCNIIEDRIYLVNELELKIYDNTGNVKSTSLQSLLTKKAKKTINSLYGFQYCLTKNILIVKNRNNLFLFERSEDKFHFQKQIEIKNRYQERRLYLDGNTVYLYGMYNYHEKSLNEHIRSGYLAINIQTGEEKLHEMPFEYIALTHIGPNNFVDFHGQNYVVCDPFKYKLTFYNFNDEVIDSIAVSDSVFTVSTDIKNFKEAFDPKKIGGNITSYFGPMHKYLNRMDRIWTVNYINNETIFIRLARNSLNEPGSNNQLLYDHVWRKAHGKWTLSQIKDSRSSIADSIIIAAADIWPIFTPGSRLIFNEENMFFCFWTTADGSFPQQTKHLYSPDTEDKNKPYLKVVKFDMK